MMTSCGSSCTTFNASEGKWFKIAERGLLTGTVREGMWAQREFSTWDGDGTDLWTEMIPRGLKRGEYLIRHEIVALHIANRPQFYPQCAHLVVRGDGEDEPGEEYLTRIPGLWSMDREFSPPCSESNVVRGARKARVGMGRDELDSLLT